MNVMPNIKTPKDLEKSIEKQKAMEALSKHKEGEEFTKEELKSISKIKRGEIGKI